MMRQLITLLAILTGLTALGAPAQARVSVMDEVRVQVSGDVAASCSSVRLLTRQGAGARRGSAVGMAGICPRPQVVVVIPTVMLQADRARE